MTAFTDFAVVYYVLVLILQFTCLFLKPHYLSTLPLIITCSVALALREDNIFILSFIQAGLVFLQRLVLFILSYRKDSEISRRQRRTLR